MENIKGLIQDSKVNIKFLDLLYIASGFLFIVFLDHIYKFSELFNNNLISSSEWLVLIFLIFASYFTGRVLVEVGHLFYIISAKLLLKKNVEQEIKEFWDDFKAIEFRETRSLNKDPGKILRTEVEVFIEKHPTFQNSLKRFYISILFFKILFAFFLFLTIFIDLFFSLFLPLIFIAIAYSSIDHSNRFLDIAKLVKYKDKSNLNKKRQKNNHE